MAHRNETSNLNPDDLNLSAEFYTEISEFMNT